VNASGGKRVDMGESAAKSGRNPGRKSGRNFNWEVRPEVEERFGLFLKHRNHAKPLTGQMWQDPKSHWWVLDYYFPNDLGNQ